MITSVFFICDYGSWLRLQAQYKRWTWITGLYNPTWHILCNWLILWQNALYLYLGKSRMCLILQETCCLSLVLKPWSLDQEASEEKLFTKTRQIARHLWTDSSTATRQIAIYRGLMRLNIYNLLRYLSRLWEFRFSDLIFGPCLCICVGFLFSQP